MLHDSARCHSTLVSVVQGTGKRYVDCYHTAVVAVEGELGEITQAYHYIRDLSVQLFSCTH